MTAAAKQGLLEELRNGVSSGLPQYLSAQRWFGGKARPIHSVRLLDAVPLVTQKAFVLFAEVHYSDGGPETYALPLVPSSGAGGAGAGSEPGKALQLTGPATGSKGALRDAFEDPAFLRGLLEAVGDQRSFRGSQGEIRMTRSSAFADLRGREDAGLSPVLLKGEQSNTSVRYGEQWILKFFRRVQEGVNPDLEIGLFLTEQAHFPHIPAVAASLDYRTRDGREATLGILQAFVPNQGNAWDYALRTLPAFYQAVAGTAGQRPKITERPLRRGLLGLADQEPPHEALDLAGPFLGAAGLLGERTAQLHLALASATTDPAFAPEPYTPAFRQQLDESLREWTGRSLGLLRAKKDGFPEQWREAAEEVVGSEGELLRRARRALHGPLTSMRTRIHGDYHLGQVLYTGSDFVIIDFEGEPARPIEERRVKRSPLQDVAGMLRSFHYAAYAPLLGLAPGEVSPGEKSQALEVWADRWWEWMSARFLRAYLETSGSSSFVPRSREELSALLELHLLEKAIYELSYELNNRPTWVSIPLRGIATLLVDAG
jgi:trehalose synthase-fused probable maltokinase